MPRKMLSRSILGSTLEFLKIGFSNLLLATALIASSPNSYAEEPDEQEALFGEIPSVFSASRHQQPVTKAPASVDIITSEQIARYGWRTVSSMLSSLPGFISTYDRAYNHIGVRGFAPPGDYNTRILVLIDGHRVNENLQDYAGLGQDFLVDVENIERVEVVRGPSSSLYGSSALFAVVNVITQRGRDLKGAKLAGEMASYDSHRGQVSIGNKFSNGMEALLSASFYHSDGQENLKFPGLGTAHNLDNEQVERLFSKTAWGNFTLSGSFMQRRKFLPAATIGATFDQLGSYYQDRRAYADLNYHRNFSNNWDLTGRLFWDSYEFNDDLISRPLGPKLNNHDVWNGQWFGGEALLSRKFFDSHHLTMGTEYRRNFLQQMSNHDQDPYYLWADNRFRSSIYGFYLQDEWSILDNLSLQAGGRYDHYDSFGGTFNPRLGLIYQPWGDTTLKFLYGTAFRAPNAFESVYTCCAGAWVGNPSLKPEQIETYEIVLEQRLNQYLDLRISPFYNRLKNLIAFTSAPIQQFQNTGNAEAHGLETQLQGHFKDIEARLSYTYQQSRSVDRDPAPNSPANMIKLNVTAPLWSEKLFAGVEIQYVSRRATVGNDWANHYTLTNLTLTSRHLFRGVELSGGIYNLFDEGYADPASPNQAPVTSLNSLATTIPQNGRNFRIRLSYDF
jgi:iron complex outermembrane receptor protein